MGRGNLSLTVHDTARHSWGARVYDVTSWFTATLVGNVRFASLAASAPRARRTRTTGMKRPIVTKSNV